MLPAELLHVLKKQLGSGIAFIENTEELGALLQKCRQVVLDDAPDQLIADGEVFVGELAKCLTDDGEFPFDRRANEPAIALVVEVDTSDRLLDGVSGLDHIAEKGPWITLHRSAI